MLICWISSLPYIFFLVVRLEMLFGARYRNATPRTLLKSENVTWNDVKTIRFFSLPPLPPIFQKFKDLRTQLNLRKFNPETGIYSRVWTPKSTAILLRNRLRQKQGPQANVWTVRMSCLEDTPSELSIPLESSRETCLSGLHSAKRPGSALLQKSR